MTPLQKFRALHKKSQQEVADYLNITRQAYSNYELEKRQADYETLLKLAEYFNTSVECLLRGPIEKDTDESNIGAIMNSDKIHMIPVFETVSAGFGAYANASIIDYIPLFIANDYDVKDTLCIKVSGDSMYPKIEDGDLIVVRKQKTVDNGQIAVVLVDGDEGYVKKIFCDKESISLVSINPEYKDKVFEKEDMNRVDILGLVQQVIKTL